VVCEPDHCEWARRSKTAVLDEYLDATVTVDTKVQTGFSAFGRYTANGLIDLVGQQEFQNHVMGGRLTDALGWLPELDIRLLEGPDPDGVADVSTTVSIQHLGGPITNLKKGTVESTLATFCEEDARKWLRPLDHQRHYPVTHEGGLANPTGAAFVQALFNTDALPASTNENERLSHLLRLVGQTNSTSFGTAPDHVVKGDYVYVPVDLKQDLTKVFK
jgi:hypothetical protein